MQVKLQVVERSTIRFNVPVVHVPVPVLETEVKGGAYSVTLHTFIVKRSLVPLPAVSLYTRDHDCTLFEAREERLLGSLRRQRMISRLADALIVMDSRLVIRVENMVLRAV